MNRVKQITITHIPEISAIYFALLQCGYDYYTIERSQGHIDCIRSFIGVENVPTFFCGTRQNTCQVYAYWPRAAILETAAFHLLPDHSQFRDSVIHEFLHHVVHPAVSEIADMVLEYKRTWPGIDDSYYLSGDNGGQLNAFEEHAVRELTKHVLQER